MWHFEIFDKDEDNFRNEFATLKISKLSKFQRSNLMMYNSPNFQIFQRNVWLLPECNVFVKYYCICFSTFLEYKLHPCAT